MAATEHRVSFRLSEHYGRCWADAAKGPCTEWADTSIGLCAAHYEALRSSPHYEALRS